MEGHWKFLGGGGSFKANKLEAKYKPKLEFLVGKWGCKTETFWGGGGESMDIFWNYTIGIIKTYCSLHQTLSLKYS